MLSCHPRRVPPNRSHPPPPLRTRWGTAIGSLALSWPKRQASRAACRVYAPRSLGFGGAPKLAMGEELGWDRVRSVRRGEKEEGDVASALGAIGASRLSTASPHPTHPTHPRPMERGGEGEGGKVGRCVSGHSMGGGWDRRNKHRKTYFFQALGWRAARSKAGSRELRYGW